MGKKNRISTKRDYMKYHFVQILLKALTVDYQIFPGDYLCIRSGHLGDHEGEEKMKPLTLRSFKCTGEESVKSSNTL